MLLWNQTKKDIADEMIEGYNNLWQKHHNVILELKMYLNGAMKQRTVMALLM